MYDILGTQDHSAHAHRGKALMIRSYHHFKAVQDINVKYYRFRASRSVSVIPIVWVKTLYCFQFIDLITDYIVKLRF
jgi:hypothetical protein